MKLILIAVLLATAASAGQLRIAVYDQAQLPKEVAGTVYENLRQIFHVSQIEIRIVAGDPAAEEASLNTYPAPPLPGHELESACGARRDIALEIAARAPSSLNKIVLGMAQPLARRGLNVTIFNDHVRGAAIRENRDHALILSHAIAHEIGHVLLRSSTHAKWGIMSAVWTKHEYRQMMNSSLFFTIAQSLEMRMNLAGSGCTNATASSGR